MPYRPRLGRRSTDTAGHLLTARYLMAVLAYGLPILFILLPLVLFLLQSFFYVENGQIIQTITVRNYVRFFADPIFVPVFVRTCFLCLGVAAITVALGYPVAYLLASIEGRLKYTMTLVFVIPLQDLCDP